jgi:hypothetical protein
VADADKNEDIKPEKKETTKSDKPAKFAADKLSHMIYYEHHGRQYLIFVFPNEVTAISIDQGNNTSSS